MKTPLGWQTKSLNQVAEVRSGLTKTSKRQGVTVRKPYVRVANVQDGFLDMREIKEIDVPAGSVERFSLKKWDFLLVEGNGNPENLGRGCSWNGQIPECVHQNHVFAVRVTDNKILRPEFFSILMQSEQVRRYFVSCAKSSSGLATLNSAQIKQCQLSIPIYREQAEIFNLHSIWSTAIEKTERLIAAKEEHYSWLLSSLISNSKYPHCHIRDFASEVSNRNSRAAIAQVLSVTNRNGFVLPEDQFERQVASSDLSNYKVVTSGQYAYNPSRINVGSIARLDNWDVGVLSPMYVVFKIKEMEVDSDFFLHWLESHEAKQHIRKSAQGSVRETVSFTDLGAIPFPIPPIDYQKQIAEILNTARQEIDLLKKQAEAFRKQKRGLMQKLLTGEWRVKTGKEAV